MATWAEDNLLKKIREARVREDRYRRYTEEVDANLILTNPVKYFDSVNWDVPQEDLQDVIDNLVKYMSKDTDISEEEVGKRGETVYSIISKLIQTGKNPELQNVLAQNMQKAQGQLSEGFGKAFTNFATGKGGKVVIATLAALLLASSLTVGASPVHDDSQKLNRQKPLHSVQYDGPNPNGSEGFSSFVQNAHSNVAALTNQNGSDKGVELDLNGPDVLNELETNLSAISGLDTTVDYNNGGIYVGIDGAGAKGVGLGVILETIKAAASPSNAHFNAETNSYEINLTLNLENMNLSQTGRDGVEDMVNKCMNNLQSSFSGRSFYANINVQNTVNGQTNVVSSATNTGSVS